MKFMILRKADAATEAGLMPSQELIAAMMAYNEELVKAGVMLDGDGLHPTSKAVRVSFEQGKPVVIDGPFAETKELLAGFTMIQVKSKEEAIEWVKRWPVIDTVNGAVLELRQVAEAADFGEAFTPELQEQEERMRQQIRQAGN